MAWLDDNPPRQRQFRDPRRKRPTGCVVVHSAENLADIHPPDTGAENVARFIRDRSDYGSYHDLCDSDSTVHLVRYEAEAYQDGTGSNPWALSVSGAFRANQWRDLPRWWRDGCIDQMARAARRQADWLHATHGITVPARRISRQQSESGAAGFISHGERDPGRRSDPGASFPWDQFLARFAKLTIPPAKLTIPPAASTPTPSPEDDMTFIIQHRTGAAVLVHESGRLVGIKSASTLANFAAKDVPVVAVDDKTWQEFHTKLGGS